MMKKKKGNEQARNKKLTTDVIRVRINRLINNTAVEIGVVDAKLTRDTNNNTIIFSEEENIKEELPGLYDSLISDVLYKLESRGLSLKEQIVKVDKAINNIDDKIRAEKDGYITEKKKSKDDFGKEIITEEQVKINTHTEKSKLRLLKCIKYTLENKKGDGFFESIELDGTRSLSYLVRDGDLIPYWHKTPNSDGEPIVLVPDVVQRKKFYKEASDEAINDFNESQDTKWRGVLGFLTKALYVIMFLALVVWTIHNARWSGDLYDESLEPKLQAYELELLKVKDECTKQLQHQLENNQAYIDYAKKSIEEEIEQKEVSNIDKANLQI